MSLVLTIDSHQGVGKLKYGMTAAEVRATVATAYEPFERTKNGRASDHFSSDGIFAYYNDTGLLNALEFHAPANVKLLGNILFECSFQQLLYLLSQNDNNIEIDDTGLTSLELGLGCYAPGHREAPNDLIEGIITFEKGYYD